MALSKSDDKALWSNTFMYNVSFGHNYMQERCTLMKQCLLAAPTALSIMGNCSDNGTTPESLLDNFSCLNGTFELVGATLIDIDDLMCAGLPTSKKQAINMFRLWDADLSSSFRELMSAARDTAGLPPWNADGSLDPDADDDDEEVKPAPVPTVSKKAKTQSQHDSDIALRLAHLEQLLRSIPLPALGAAPLAGAPPPAPWRDSPGSVRHEQPGPGRHPTYSGYVIPTLSL
jgi:hypothetical protein